MMKGLTRYLTILRLKLLDLLAMRGLILAFAIVPLLLGFLAGAANLTNRRPDVRLAIIDQDQSAASRNLAERLTQNGWTADVTTEDKALRLLLQNKIDGMIYIEPGYSSSLADLKTSHLRYVAAEGSLVTSLVREAVAAAVLPEYSQQYLLALMREQYQATGTTAPSDLENTFSRGMAAYADGLAKLRVNYIGRIEAAPTLTLLVSDYSVEVEFLSVYAVLGVITLSRAAQRRRLASASRGILLDYTASLLALMLIGLGQVLLYAASMWLILKAAPRPQDIGMIGIFLCLMLGIGQLLSLINENLRLYLSLLVLLLSAIAGGCFFPLTEKLLGLFGQYTPHGWLMSMLKGYPALPPIAPLGLALCLLALGYGLQIRRVTTEDETS
jgi:hypothetical protein